MPLVFTSDLPFFTKYESSFKVSGCLQLSILLLASIVLDEGEVLRFMLLAAEGYWCAVAFIMVRRNGNATRLDQCLLKWGYPLAIALTAFVSALAPIGLFRHA